MSRFTDVIAVRAMNDYIKQKYTYEEQINKAKEMLKEADIVLIGAGAGISTAAGHNYCGGRFTSNFKDFIEYYSENSSLGSRYFRDMYSAGFYPFETEEKKWGYWSKHVKVNLLSDKGEDLYKELYKLLEKKEYFIVTTNVDRQFEKAGFDKNKIFATQGDYGYIQCETGKHGIVKADELFEKMDKERKGVEIPGDLVPHCETCGSRMVMHLRVDNNFCQDSAWYEALDNYKNFLEKNKDKNVLLLELGVGYNTPTIIKYPFESFVSENTKWKLLRINYEDGAIPREVKDRSLGIEDDINKVIEDIENR